MTRPLLLIALVGAVLVAGSGAHPAAGQDRPVRVTLRPVVQRMEVDTEIGDGETVEPLREASTTLSVELPLGERWLVTARGRVLQAGGDAFESVRGFDDTQVSVSRTTPIDDGDLVLGVDVQVPTGKQSLSPGALQTATALSRDRYDFHAPSFGQGWQVAPRAAVAYPAGDDLMLGATVTARWLGGYTPLQDMTRPYVPGNALRVSTGADLRLTPTSALSADLALTTYGTDTVGGADRLALSNRWTATVRYLNRFGFHRAYVVAHYQYRRRSTFFAPRPSPSPSPDPSDLRVRPRESFLRAGFRWRLVPDLFATVEATGALFQETERQPSARVLRLRLRPSWSPAERWTLFAHATATTGDVRGVEGGLGVSLAIE